MGKKTPRSWRQREAFMRRAGEGRQREEGQQIFELMEYFAGTLQQVDRARVPGVSNGVSRRTIRGTAARAADDRAANTDKLAVHADHASAASRCCRRTSTRASALTVVPEGVRFGLTAIKGWRRRDQRSSRCERPAGDVVHQLCEELDLRIVNKKVLEALVKSGARQPVPPVSACRPAAPRCWRGGQRHRTRQPHAAR
jgi:DNA polymerase-3 subunit alpha